MAPRTVRVRSAADLPACVRVLADVHRADGYPLNWPAHPSAWLSLAGLRNAWVAEDGGRLDGHAVLADVDDDGGLLAGRLVALSRLFVTPDARGSVVGTALVRTAVAVAGTQGLRVVLDVVEGTPPSGSTSGSAGD
ncbi:GNAT family N-acetyltransferase [Geodermatophilus sp. DF01-2]|uniref:GNAT family N-acetyltransferase n=1 Tax=Geodermatophilus sp. DF01-2 TaxID=2559610 RepID=UPI0010746115|nr:GNAT family N-acetyltransferase [Geodermatophilus sp. DF01_2]TFV54175.1 GNAT family N-acetyltransferase [Geodermatophilus sp. DF01_2]